MARCIALLSDVQHTQRPELLAEALENAATLRKMISVSEITLVVLRTLQDRIRPTSNNHV